MDEEIVFSDETIKQHIELSTISDEEKAELIELIPSFDQVQRARLIINLQMQRALQDTRDEEAVYDNSPTDEQVTHGLQDLDSKKKVEHSNRAAALKSAKILDRIKNS